jgi:hypothetical protein
VKKTTGNLLTKQPEKFEILKPRCQTKHYQLYKIISDERISFSNAVNHTGNSFGKIFWYENKKRVSSGMYDKKSLLLLC